MKVAAIGRSSPELRSKPVQTDPAISSCLRIHERKAPGVDLGVTTRLTISLGDIEKSSVDTGIY